MRPIIAILSNDLDELIKTKAIFKNEGFDVHTYSVVDESCINNIYSNNPDIILLDLHINNSDGIELCYNFKKENVLHPFIVLFTEHQEEYIQIEAFKAGADDYIVKPINPRILLKKINALLNRKKVIKNTNLPKIVFVNKLKIDRERYLVFNDGKSICLPRKQFEMLFLFINNPKKVFSRKDIYQQIWNVSDCLNSRIIDVHVRKIREQVGENVIRTIKGIGYQFAEHSNF